jgi:ABC-type transport system involved in multi-copper enzyme maturation permease subunit
LPLFAATIAGSQLAGEARDGTLRAMLVRPPSRAAVYVAKGIASYLWLQLMVFFLVGLALLLGRVVLGGGPFLIFLWEFRHSGPWILGGHDWIWVFLVVSLGAGLSLFAISSLALMLSALTDHPVVAHIGTLGCFFISTALQRLPEDLMAPSVRDLLPTRHMNFWHELYRLFHPAAGSFDQSRFLTDAAWCAAYSITFLTVGLLVFRRKDITS